MVEPYYQEIKAENIPKYLNSNIKITILAGNIDGQVGPCKSISGNISFFDIEIQPNTSYSLSIDDNMNGFIYLFEGDKLDIGSSTLKKYQAGKFTSKLLLTLHSKHITK